MAGDDRDLQGFKLYRFVADLFDRGIGDEQIRQNLTEKGIPPEEATRLVDRLATQRETERAKARARSLFGQGMSAEETRRELQTEGHGESAVAAAIDEVVEASVQEVLARGSPSQLWLTLGILSVIVGLVLLVGNRTGLMPTFPFSGTVFLATGIILLMMSRDAGEST